MLKPLLSIAAALAMALPLSAVAAPADDKPAAQNVVRIGVPYGDPIQCTVKVGLEDIAVAYYSGTDAKLQSLLDDVFACETKAFTDLKLSEYSVVMFLAKPTEAAADLSLVHVVYRRKNSRFASTTLPGVTALNWIYLTETGTDRIVSQVTAAPSSNPILAQLGGLIAALEKPFEKSQEFREDHTLTLIVAPSAGLTFKRSTISEADFVATIVKNDKGEPVKKQITGTLSLSNSPRTWIMANAVVGAAVRDPSGVQRMKVDNKAYASDPLPLGLTAAGVTLHVPYDPLPATPSPQEILGLFVGGTLTPAGGVAIGASIGWRGIAFVFGRAWLRVQTAPPDKTAGDAVPSGLNPQLVTGVTSTMFIGGSYAFGK